MSVISNMQMLVFGHCRDTNTVMCGSWFWNELPASAIRTGTLLEAEQLFTWACIEPPIPLQMSSQTHSVATVAAAASHLVVTEDPLVQANSRLRSVAVLGGSGMGHGAVVLPFASAADLAALRMTSTQLRLAVRRHNRPVRLTDRRDLQLFQLTALVRAGAPLDRWALVACLHDSICKILSQRGTDSVDNEIIVRTMLRRLLSRLVQRAFPSIGASVARWCAQLCRKTVSTTSVISVFV
jgi:hypothetical protein